MKMWKKIAVCAAALCFVFVAAALAVTAAPLADSHTMFPFLFVGLGIDLAANVSTNLRSASESNPNSYNSAGIYFGNADIGAVGQNQPADTSSSSSISPWLLLGAGLFGGWLLYRK